MIIDVRLSVDPFYEPKDVAGEIVDIAPHLSHLATWIVHRDPWATWRWQVTNVESGRNAGDFYSSRNEAVKNVRSKLLKITPQKVLAAYKKAGVK